MLPHWNNNTPIWLLSSIYKRRFKKNHSRQFTKIPGFMFCFVSQGKGVVRIDDQVMQLNPHQIYLLTPGTAIEVMLESEFADYYLMVPAGITIQKHKGTRESLTAVDPVSSLLPTGQLHLNNAKPLLERVKQLYEDSRNPLKNAAGLQLQFQSLMHSMLQNVPEPADSKETGKGIDQSIDYMYKHFRQKIKLEVLSEIAGLTPTSYSRSFKKAKGVSPVEYLNQIRIDSSKHLLSGQSSSIKEVADSVGFGNEFYFSRMFKRATGISPTMYVKRRELRIAVASCFRYYDNLRSLGVDALAEMNVYQYVDQMEEAAGLIRAQLNGMRQVRPDLIIADYRHLPFYGQLKQIAPTVILDFTMDWRVNHIKIGDLVGREKEARNNITQLEQKVKYAKKILAQTIGNESLAVIRLYNRKIRVQGIADHPLNDLLYGGLGLKPGSCVPVNIRTFEFPLDNLPPFETDHLFIYKHRMAAGDNRVFQDLQKFPSWNAMKAVQSNQTRLIPNWIGMSWAPVGQNQIIDELLQWKLEQ